MIYLPPVPHRMLYRARVSAAKLLRVCDNMKTIKLKARFLDAHDQCVGFRIRLRWQKAGTCDDCVYDEFLPSEAGRAIVHLAYPMSPARDGEIERMIGLAMLQWAEEWIERNLVKRSPGDRVFYLLNDQELRRVLADTEHATIGLPFRLGAMDPRQASAALSLHYSSEHAVAEHLARQQESHHSRVERLRAHPSQVPQAVIPDRMTHTLIN